MTITQILQKIRSAFYTKAETDAKLNGKSNTNHNHNSTYLGIKAKAESAKSADSVAWANVSSRPTKVSQLTNDSGYVKDIDLADVATSGSYNDLADKPTIPSVYNKTLTIQKNGTKVAAFTSNSNSNVTANITVPTKVSELTNDSGFITGISWNKVTGKPTLATVATSGSYNDLSNKPTITQNYLGRQPKTFKTLWTGHFASDSVKLSEPFTNYKWLLVKLSNDNDWGMHYHYISTYDLNIMLEGEKHGGYVNKSVTLGGSYLYWNIHTYANGSTTTYFSYEDDNCRLREIIGINEFY